MKTFNRVCKLLVLFYVMCVGIVARAQEPTLIDMELEKANQAFNMRKYNTAANRFIKVIPKIKDEQKRDQAIYMVAESYRLANNFKRAVEWYEKVLKTKYPDPKILYSYGLLLKNFERYEEASRQFYDYLFEVPEDPNAIREQQSCAIAIEWKSKPERFNVTNISELNTPYSDYSPFYINQKLIWSSARTESTGNEIFEWTGQKCSDYFEASIKNNKWSSVQKVKGSVNTNFNEGTAWIDTAHSTMYLTQCNGADGKGLGCKVYVSYHHDTGWSVPDTLPFNSDFFSNGHPAMTPDGKRLYFSSDMPGGYGLKDIYYVDYNPVNNTWGKPVNLGPNVNTTEDEMFPFVDEDGVVYFSSKGWTGMGGLDIYTTRNIAGAFSPARNLKSPINSGGDDFGISFVPKAQRVAGEPIAYYSSNREGGKGDDDIYAITVKPFFFVIKGEVLDAVLETPIVGAQVLVDKNDNNNILKVLTGNDGLFVGEIPVNVISQLHVEREGYFNTNPIDISSMNVVNDTTVELKIYMQAIPQKEVELVLEGIYYDLDRFDLRNDAKLVLDSLVKILNSNPSIVIELASHTDSRADKDYNDKLSQKRAQSCVDYLAEKGIDKQRMVAKGYGETKLVNTCSDGVDCTEEEHQQNRRTTIRVLRTDFKTKRK